MILPLVYGRTFKQLRGQKRQLCIPSKPATRQTLADSEGGAPLWRDTTEFSIKSPSALGVGTETGSMDDQRSCRRRVCSPASHTNRPCLALWLGNRLRPTHECICRAPHEVPLPSRAIGRHQSPEFGYFAMLRPRDPPARLLPVPSDERVSASSASEAVSVTSTRARSLT